MKRVLVAAILSGIGGIMIVACDQATSQGPVNGAMVDPDQVVDNASDPTLVDPTNPGQTDPETPATPVGDGTNAAEDPNPVTPVTDPCAQLSTTLLPEYWTANIGDPMYIGLEVDGDTCKVTMTGDGSTLNVPLHGTDLPAVYEDELGSVRLESDKMEDGIATVISIRSYPAGTDEVYELTRYVAPY